MAFAELLLDFLFIETKVTDQDIFSLFQNLVFIFFIPQINTINKNTRSPLILLKVV